MIPLGGGALLTVLLVLVVQVGGALLLMRVLLADQGRHQMLPRRRELGEGLDLQVEKNGFAGVVDGVGVSVDSSGLEREGSTCKVRWGQSAAWKGLFVARPVGFFDLGEDVQIGDDALDRALRITGCERTAKAVLLDPEVRQLHAELSRHGDVVWRPEHLEVHFSGPLKVMHRGLLDLGAQLIQVAENVRVRPWHDAAELYSLELSEDATRLMGRVQGFVVDVHQTGAEEREEVMTVVQVSLGARLPAGTHITCDGDGERIGDPILDSAICVKGDAEILGPLLCQDETRALLMSVVHGFPGSEVNETDIILRASGRLMHELEATLRDVVELAAALQPLRQSPIESRNEARRRAKQST